MNKILNKNNRNISWGEIGPKLVTRLVNDYQLNLEIQPSEIFYPRHWKQALDALNPEKTTEVENSCKNSFVYHYWNEIIKKKKINKNELPPINSFIYNKLFKRDSNV